MLREYDVKGKKQLSFVVKEGPANDVIIPLSYLQPVDYQRLVKMEEAGGELMKVLRDTKLDNGKEAIVQYQDLFVVVEKERKEEISVTASATDTTTPRRGRGRPKGSKNKPKA